MSGSVNKTILLGRLGKDPEIKTFSSGDKVANFSIATSESWIDKASGEKKEKTEWTNVAVYGKLADIVERFVTKGSKVYVEGKLQTRKWQDSSGQDKYSTEVVLQGFGGNLTLLDSKGSSQGKESGYAEDDLSDEVPFN